MKEREAALAEARESSKKVVEEVALLRERTMMVEETVSKAREEALSYKNAVADLDKEKDLLRPRNLSKDEGGVREWRDRQECRGGGQKEGY